mgnify:CR=1 FL=1
MKIIYEGRNGILAQLIPAPKFLATLTGTDEEKLIYVAKKDLATGTKYEITDADLSDRTFRNAWEYTSDASVEKTSEDLTPDELAKHDMTENL